MAVEDELRLEKFQKLKEQVVDDFVKQELISILINHLEKAIERAKIGDLANTRYYMGEASIIIDGLTK